MFGAGLSLALIGVGHLVGLAVGISMLTGMLISYGVMLPIHTLGKLDTGEPLEDIISTIFSQDVRMIGAGAIAVASIWTLLKIMRPIIRGISASLAATRNRQDGKLLDITERDISFSIVGTTAGVLMFPIAFILWDFARKTTLHGSSTGVVLMSVLFISIVGFIAAAICGYMAGLVGSSNSPVSGVGILVVVLAALVIKMTFGHASDNQALALMALTLIATAITFCAATIANDNLQDLKTGQLVAATPWRQQAALIVGVVAGSLVIPFLLNLLNSAFGFNGGPPATVAGTQPLGAPQATLISTLAAGVLGGDPRWDLIGYGAILGVVIIAIDEILVRTTNRKYKLPPLAVGIGIYLPMAVTTTVTIGAIIGTVYDRWVAKKSKNPEPARRLGILVASGLIVGESLFNVLLAGLIVATNNGSPFGFVPTDGFWVAPWPMLAGIVVFFAMVWWLYAWTKSKADRI
jgi:putative OPT family oligopeptide transporter